jgi:hypothetical protein
LTSWCVEVQVICVSAFLNHERLFLFYLHTPDHLNNQNNFFASMNAD